MSRSQARRRPSPRVLIFAVAALVLAACGGAEETDPAADGSEDVSTAEESPEEDEVEEEPADAEDTAASESETEEAPEPATIDFGLPTIMGPNNSPMAVAEGMGYFEEEGLTVNIINTGGSVDTVQATITGQIDIGSATPEPVMQARAEGGGDLVMVYNYIRAPTGSLAVPADSDIESLEDFRGARIGSSSLGSGNILLANGILAKADVDESEVEYLAVGVGGQALQALSSGQVDALTLWDTEYAAMEAQGQPLRLFSHPDAERLFSTTYFVTPEYLDENQDVIARFGRAMAKASLFAVTNPEAALQIMYRDYPDTRIAGQSEDDQLEEDLIGLTARNGLLVAGDDPVATESWGVYDGDAVSEWVQFALEADILSQDLNPDDLYTNAMADTYNDFDMQQVIDDAESWTP